MDLTFDEGSRSPIIAASIGTVIVSLRGSHLSKSGNLTANNYDNEVLFQSPVSDLGKPKINNTEQLFIQLEQLSSVFFHTRHLNIN